jgi:hypothetical protein
VNAVTNTTARIRKSSRTLQAVVPKSLFLSLLVGHGTVLLLMSMFGYDLSRLQSLLSVSFAAFCGLTVLFVLYARKAFGNTAILIMLSAFILKVMVGVFHSLHFFDPDYFNNTAGFEYFKDYMWMEGKMRDASDYWRQDGLSLLPITWYANTKNLFILAYNGLLYYLSGENYINISPWNALHSLYVAIIVGALALEAGATKVQSRFALALAAFQPFGFISNIMWRDSVGQFWMLLGVYLLIVTRDKKYLWVIALPVACFLAYSQREPYLLVTLTVASYLLLSSVFQEKLKLRTKVAIAILLLATLWFLPQYSTLAFDRYGSGGQLSFAPLQFPLRILRALAGPFPWFQIFMGVDGAEFMLPDFLQAVYNLTLLILVIPLAFKMWKDSKRIEPCMLFALLLYVMAIQATGVHIAYLSIGIVLLIPMVCQVSAARWLRTFSACFYCFLFANILYWILGLSGSGIIMNITGY